MHPSYCCLIFHLLSLALCLFKSFDLDSSSYIGHETEDIGADARKLKALFEVITDHHVM